MDVQKYLMEPLFFASIGFAIPFVQLWTGKRIWRGIVYTLLMIFAKVRLLGHCNHALWLTTITKFVVGVWVPLWGCWPIRKRQRKSGTEESRSGEENRAVQRNADSRNQATMWLSALLLGSAMVARGEIGLLIIEIGYNQTSYVTEEGFITGVWAILLNTIIGPATVGILVKYCGKRIGEGEWGLQRAEMPAQGLERPTPILQSA
jgi:Kef-type K+ transport system membrane component KefB